jgi:GNAT superfamily N-acetyltransferase
LQEAARPAVDADLPAIADLFAAATVELRAEKGGELWARERDRAAGFRAPLAGDGLVLAGTVDDVVVGYAVVRAERFADGGEVAVVDDVYVEPGARGIGIGELLLDACIAWARERGCVGIDSVALPGMRETKNFFETAGLVARAIVVHKKLS